MKILLAVRESEKGEFRSVLQRLGLQVHVWDQLSDFTNSVSDFQFALIDEDFAGRSQSRCGRIPKCPPNRYHHATWITCAESRIRFRRR